MTLTYSKITFVKNLWIYAWYPQGKPTYDRCSAQKHRQSSATRNSMITTHATTFYEADTTLKRKLAEKHTYPMRKTLWKAEAIKSNFWDEHLRREKLTKSSCTLSWIQRFDIRRVFSEETGESHQLVDIANRPNSSTRLKGSNRSRIYQPQLDRPTSVEAWSP